MNAGERRRAEAVLVEADQTLERLRAMLDRLADFTAELDRVAEGEADRHA